MACYLDWSTGKDYAGQRERGGEKGKAEKWNLVQKIELRLGPKKRGLPCCGGGGAGGEEKEEPASDQKGDP